MSDKAEPIRVVVYSEGDAWVAQALELDICAQGANPDEARDHFLDTLDCELNIALQEGEDPAVTIGPAPSQFFAMWDQRSTFSSTERLEGGEDGRVEMALCA